MIDDILIKTPKNYPLSAYTTLKIGGQAEMVFFPSRVEEILEIRNYLLENNKKITVIGAGSNLLVSSQGVSGGVILTNKFNNYEMLDEGRIKVDAGIKSVQLAKILHDHSLSGLEFLIGIPGALGGAVTMNSSAHGQSIKDVIESVEVINLQTGEVTKMDKDQLDLGYRYSFVESNKHLILNATFSLKEDNPQDILNRMEFHVNYRKQNHPPLTEPSAGSTFRNPAENAFIGQLLEQLGAKSWVEGGAKISEKHANFIINTGNATSIDVSRLMYRMYTEIKNNFGYEPIAEIRYVGDSTEEEEIIWKSFQVH